MNKKIAKQWLIKAWHNVSGAKLFYEANHYTDVTAVELHYAVEKTLKSMIVCENKKIPKTHDLYEIYKLIQHFINLEDHLDLLDRISKYHIEEAYPQYDRQLPSKDEIKEVLDFTEELFTKVCKILDIDKREVMR